MQGAFELAILDRVENNLELWTRFPTQADEIATGEKGRRNERFIGKLLAAAPKELIVVQQTMASKTVHAV
jgi:hypothetical protein